MKRHHRQSDTRVHSPATWLGFLLLIAGGVASAQEAIVYQHRVNGKLDLYYQRLDRAEAVRLTDFPGHEQFPALSPSGDKVVFESDHDGQRDLYVIRIDGTDLRRLTNDRDVEEWPEWSPDGSQIAYTAGWNDENDVYVIDADGGVPVQYTSFPGREGHVSWSPDGGRIAFHSESTGQFDIYIVTLDSGAIERITTHPADDIRPAWSPNGASLLFQSTRGVFDWRIESYSFASGQIRPFGPLTGDTGMADWSPNGDQVVFRWEHIGGPGGLYIMDANGGGARPFGALSNATEPSWSCYRCGAPEGLSFASSQGGAYVVPGMRHEGFTIVPLDTAAGPQLFVTYYTYGPSGESLWLTATAAVSEFAGAEGEVNEYVAGVFLEARGGSYGPDLSPEGDPAELIPYTGFELYPVDCNTMAMDIENIPEPLELKRIVPLTTCN